MMKHAKKSLVVLLLLALLLSSCGEIVPPAAEQAPEAVEAAAPLREEPTVSYFAQPLAASGSVSAVTKEADGLFSAKFEGSEVAGSGESVDGVYRFIATQTDGEAWHVKLESNYPTVAGRDYCVTYRFRSDVAGKVKFGDFQEFEIREGENEVSGILIATGGTSYLDLQLGMLPPFTIDFSEIEIEEYADEVEYEDALSAPVNFEKESLVYEKHDQGYAPVLTRSKDGVSINYVAAPWETGVWKSKLYVRTGLVPEIGERYHITADVTGDQDMPFEILFNNGDEEKGYGALYGQNLTAGQTTSCEAVITGSGDGDELVLQFSLGEAPEESTVQVGNLRVETIRDHYTSLLPASFALDKTISTGRTLYGAVPTSYKNIPLTNFSFSGVDTVYDWHADGYETELEESGDSAVLKITQAPAEGREAWKVALLADTGVTLEAGKTYRIKYDLKSEAAQGEYVVCFAGDTEKAYGALYERSLAAGGTDSVEYVITPDASHGPLTIKLQVGNTDTTAGNTFTLSGISVETLDASYQSAGDVSLSGGTAGNVWEEHDDGFEQTVSASGNTATLNVTAARDGADEWNSKLIVDTGLVPEAGARYRVSAKIEATAALNNFHIRWNNEGMDVPYAGQWNIKAGGVFTYGFTAPASADDCHKLVLALELGKTAVPNTITVSDLQVCKITAEEKPVDLGAFAYPVTSEATTTHVDAAYAAQTVSLSGSMVGWDGMGDAQVSTESGKVTLNVGSARSGGGLWSLHLYADTGLALTPGEKYLISAKLHSVKGFNEFELLYNNGTGEDKGYSFDNGGDHSWYGQNIGDNETKLFEREITVPADKSGCGNLVLHFQIGNSPAGNTVTVSDVTVKKWVPEHDEITGGTTNPNAFQLEPNAGETGTDAVLTGDGSSATVKVITPGSDWHIKLHAHTGVTLTEGKTYRVEATVSGSGGWGIDFRREGYGDNDFLGDLAWDPVRNTVTAKMTGELDVQLKLGAVAADGSVTISGIKVYELTETVGENLMPSLTSATSGSVNLGAQEDGYASSLAVSDGSAKVSVSSVPESGREAWKLKTYVHTGLTLTAGTTYRLSADVASTVGMDYEFCGNDGALGSVTAAAGGTAVLEVTPESDAELVLQFNLGLAPSACDVTISNVKVEEMVEGASENAAADFSYDSVGYLSTAVDDGYIATLDRDSSSATLNIQQAPDERNPWNVKLFVRTGFTPEKGKGYRVSFDLTAAKEQGLFEVFYDGSSEMAYGALYNQKLKAEKQTVSYIIMPGDSKGELVLQLRPGKTDGTDGNSYTVSNLKLEEVTFMTTSTPETKEACELVTQNGYTANLEKSPNKATVRFEKTPAEGREPWKTKLFVVTGATLKPGQKYRVSMLVKSIIPAPFEVCFNNGDVEKGLGAMFNLIATPSGQYVEYVTYAKQETDLVIQLSLGNCMPPNSIILSDVKVEKAGAINPVSDTIYTF